MTSSRTQIEIDKVRANSSATCDDFVAVEEPLEIRVGYDTPTGRTSSSLSITMRTPGDDVALALGFLWSEGIVTSKADIASIKPTTTTPSESGNENVVRIDLAPGVDVDLDRLQRHFYTTSSCGVCGKSSLDALHVAGAMRLPSDIVRFSKEVLVALPNSLRDRQATFDSTGGLHAAALFNSQGEILISHEDVGRHNAVDKVVGSAVMDGNIVRGNCGLIVSGRASFELLQKTLIAEIPLLAAVSAPSSLAVELAQEFNVTLVAFLRGDTYNVYSAKDRLL